MAKITEIKEEIMLPEDVTATFTQNTLSIQGAQGELKRTFSHPDINISLKDTTIIIRCGRPRRKQKALVGTFRAHINNMIHGVTEGFEYHMKTVYSHFPIKTAVQESTFIVENFLGERSPRKARILDSVAVEISGEMVTVKGIDKEKVGQTVANIERATAVKKRDIRVFQDGIYRIDRGGNL
jgi:large subunit ribosomal protein L6